MKQSENAERLEVTERANEVWNALSGIKIPGYNIDVISFNLIERIRLSRDCKKVAIFVNFISTQPHCLSKIVMHDVLFISVINTIKKAIKELGFEEVILVDSKTGQEL
ncbi:MAG: hypothetical protein QXP36_09925 [Conexivisphaerales archaeon]